MVPKFGKRFFECYLAAKHALWRSEPPECLW
jgi:hypothetical protein